MKLNQKSDLILDQEKQLQRCLLDAEMKTNPDLSGVRRRQGATAAGVRRLPHGRGLLQAARQRLAAVERRAARIHFRARTSDSARCCGRPVVERELLQCALKPPGKTGPVRLADGRMWSRNQTGHFNYFNLFLTFSVFFHLFLMLQNFSNCLFLIHLLSFYSIFKGKYCFLYSVTSISNIKCCFNSS